MPRQEKLRILAVEDNPADFRLLKEFLREDPAVDFGIRQATTLREAMDQLSSQEFNIILLDLNLPDSAGLGSIERIQRAAPALPVIVFTGIGHEETGIQALHRGAQDYLVKGKIQGSDLVKSMRYAIERKRSQEKIDHLASFPRFSPHPIIELDACGKIIFSNLSAIEILERLHAAKQIKLFLPGDIAHIVKTLTSNNSGRLEKFSREVRIKDAFFDESIVVVPELRVVRIYAHDITTRKAAEEQLKKARDESETKVLLRTSELVATNKQLTKEILRRVETEKEINARNAMLKLLNEADSRKTFLDSALKLVMGWSQCRFAGIRILNEGGRIPYESYINYDDKYLSLENDLSINTDDCVCIRVVKGNLEPEDKPFMNKSGSFSCPDTSIILRNIPKQAEHKFRATCIQQGFRTLVVIPIRRKNEIIGAVHFADYDPDKLDSGSRETIEGLCGLIGEGVYKFNLEDKIKKDHTLLEAFYRHSISPLVFLDRDFNFIRVNAAYAAACKKKPEEFIGRNHFEFYPQEENEAIFRQVVKTGKPFQANAKPFVFPEHPERGITYWDWNLIPVLDDKGEVFLLVFSLNDVTQRKQQEEKLHAARLELEQARRLSDIGTLAATVAHELRNPLAAIGLAASNIKRKANNPQLDKHLATIEKKVSESDQIISNLLYYSRIKPPHYETVDLGGIVSECLDTKRSQVRKEVSLKLALDKTANLLVKADPLQMREVFSNIIDNACDALPQEGGNIEIAVIDDEASVKISIGDNGCGIEKEILDRVFDPFFTTKAKGTGLGLSVCRQIVDMHGGSISIESEPRQGTSVTVSLPKKA